MAEATIQNLFSLISDMEPEINTAHWLALAVRYMGQTGEKIEPAAVFAVGDALVERAARVREQWDAVHSLAAELRKQEGGG